MITEQILNSMKNNGDQLLYKIKIKSVQTLRTNIPKAKLYKNEKY